MADVFETSVKLKFIVPTAEADRIKKIVNASMSGGLKDRLGGVASMIGGKGMALAGGLAAAGAVVMSSPSLQGTLKRLLRMVELIIKPIGDIVAVGLRPIIDILRPIGQFFRILIQPYIRKATEAMRLGKQFAMKGQYAEAGAAYALGAAYLLKPFFDMMITVTTVSVQGILAGIKLLGSALISLVPFTEDVNKSFQKMMDGAILNVGIGGATIITETSIMMETWLTDLKLGYKKIENLANVSMGITSGFVGEGFVRIVQAATDFFAPQMKETTGKMFDSIVEYGRTKVAELNALLNKPAPTYTTGGGAYIGGVYVSAIEQQLQMCIDPLMAAKAAFNNLAKGLYTFKNPFQDFIWRSGTKPVAISSKDTIVGTKGGAGLGNIIVEVGGIRIDKISSDYDVGKIADKITERVIDNLRSRA